MAEGCPGMRTHLRQKGFEGTQGRCLGLCMLRQAGWAGPVLLPIILNLELWVNSTLQVLDKCWWLLFYGGGEGGQCQKGPASSPKALKLEFVAEGMTGKVNQGSKDCAHS